MWGLVKAFPDFSAKFSPQISEHCHVPAAPRSRPCLSGMLPAYGRSSPAMTGREARGASTARRPPGWASGTAPRSSALKERDVDVETWRGVAGDYPDTEHVKFKDVPAVQAASATFRGSYDRFGAVNEAVAAWAEDKGWSVSAHYGSVIANVRAPWGQSRSSSWRHSASQTSTLPRRGCGAAACSPSPCSR